MKYQIFNVRGRALLSFSFSLQTNGHRLQAYTWGAEGEKGLEFESTSAYCLMALLNEETICDCFMARV